MSSHANPNLYIDPVVVGAPPQEARAATVLVHGRDQDEQVMLDVVERLMLDDVAYMLPVAANRTWYPNRYWDPVEKNEPNLTCALEAIEAAIVRITDAGIRHEELVLCGFSQGACLIAELVASRPRPYLGVAILTGSLVGLAGERSAPANVNGLPIYISCSRYDEWVSFADAEATAEAFRRAGANVTFEAHSDREHVITDRAVAGLKALLSR
jgi:predicted esterase